MTEVIVMENAAYQKMMGQIAKIAEFITKNEHKLQDCDFDNDVWLDTAKRWTAKRWRICCTSAPAPCNV